MPRPYGGCVRLHINFEGCIESAAYESAEIAGAQRKQSTLVRLSKKAVLMKRETWLCCSLVAGLSIILYVNTITGEFVYDDHGAIENNKDVRMDTSLSELFNNDFWGMPLSDPESHKSFRPITTLTFRWNRIIHGMWSPGFHVVNIILHAIVSSLYLIVCLGLGVGNWTSMVASLLFSAHPVHTEAVANIVGRTELLSAIFFLFSLLSYQKMIAYRHKPLLPPILWLSFSILSCVLSVLSKEQGIMVLLVSSAYDIFIVNKLNLKDLLMVVKGIFKLRFRVCKLIFQSPLDNTSRFSLAKRVIINITATLVIISLRLYINGRGSPFFVESDNPASFCPYLLTRMLTYIYLCALNMWLLFCPSRLCFDWSMGSIPLLETWSDSRNVFSLTSFMVLTLLLISSAFRQPTRDILYITKDVNSNCSNNNNNNINNNNNNNNNKVINRVRPVNSSVQTQDHQKNVFQQSRSKVTCCNPSRQHVILFALSLLVLPFLPASNFFFPVGFVVAERILYLPSMGSCLLIAIGTDYLRFGKKSIKAISFFLCATLVIYSAKTVNRNYAWGDTRLLAESAVSVNPGNAKVFMVLGNYYAQQGVRKCERFYRDAIRIRPNYTNAWTNLGLVLLNTERPQEAENCYRKALSIKADHINANTNMGHLCRLQGRWKEARDHYKTALSRRPNNPALLYNLGVVLEKLGSPADITESVRVLRHSLVVFPDQPKCLILLGSLLASTDSTGKKIQHGYSRGRRLKEAIQFYQHGLQLQSDAEAHYELGRICLLKGDLRDAELQLKSALKLSPSHARAHYELGNTYREARKKGKAEIYYETAFKLDSSLRLQYQHVLESMNQ